jgi:hypothetical protein
VNTNTALKELLRSLDSILGGGPERVCTVSQLTRPFKYLNIYLQEFTIIYRSRNSVAITETRLLAERETGFASHHGQDVYLFFKDSRPAVGSSQPPIQRELKALSSGIMQPGRESDHSVPARAEVEHVPLLCA